MSLSTSFDRGDAEAQRVNRITETIMAVPSKFIELLALVS
jgi:hypothetical protein